MIERCWSWSEAVLVSELVCLVWHLTHNDYESSTVIQARLLSKPKKSTGLWKKPYDPLSPLNEWDDRKVALRTIRSEWNQNIIDNVKPFKTRVWNPVVMFFYESAQPAHFWYKPTFHLIKSWTEYRKPCSKLISTEIRSTFLRNAWRQTPLRQQHPKEVAYRYMKATL